jgi:CheY-like chemotaxis protein
MSVILIVEDDVFIGEVAQMMIQDWGHHTLMASDVGEALIILRSNQPIDALFTDIYLKTDVLGGFELADEGLMLRPLLRILYTSGNSVTETMKSLFAEGAKLLCKPYTEIDLRQSVDHMLAI